MDLTTILIFIGFILSGVIIGFPIGHICGRKAVWREVDDWEMESESARILDAEVIQ